MSYEELVVKKAREDGEVIGFEIGRMQAQLAVVRRLIESGVPMDAIVRTTRLSEEEIRLIAKRD
jgi:hypothetical protein